jgi:dTDP-4-amino-4,6-dideoxygalactose transaminase
MLKHALADLACLGGAPLFNEKCFVGRPNLAPSEEILSELHTIFESRWLSNDGPYLKAFEAQICEKLKVKNCIAVSNGTIGLELLIRALDLKGEVIVPSFTFVATAHALQWLGLKPVFCDILPKTHTLDPAQVKKHISPQTSAILGVHLWGLPCEIKALEALAAEYNLKLIFDAAHAFLCDYQGQSLGNFGNAEVFSFHATKFVNSLEGGAITTNDDQLAEKLRLMRNFGFVDYDQVEALGINAKMNEVCAAVGQSSLKYSQDYIAHNHQNYLAYQQAIAHIPGLSLLPLPASSNFQYLVIEVNALEFGLTRDQLVKILHAENLIARRYFYPGCHRVRPYAQLYPEAGQYLPITERVSERVMLLPTGTSTTQALIEKTGSLLRFIYEKAAEIQQAV